MILPDPKAADVQIYRWELSKNILFVIHTGVRPNCSTLVARFKLSAKNPPGDIVPGSIKDISTEDYAGVEYGTSSNTSGKTFSRFYCVKERAYDLTIAYPLQQAKPTMANRFFSSFRLLHQDTR